MIAQTQTGLGDHIYELSPHRVKLNLKAVSSTTELVHLGADYYSTGL